MPAVITHDQFGREVLALPATAFITTEEERQAFLLGNQGPDPLFYCVANPTLLSYKSLGNLMHNEKPSELIAAMAHSVQKVPTASRGIARAYAAGFLCHYLLDRTAHPLVYAQQFALCNAGEDGLCEKDGSDVHAVIETELDEMMLFTRTGKTVATFAPEREILRSDKQALSVMSYQIHCAFQEAYGITTDPDLFAKSVRCFRKVQRLFHSGHGVKRSVLGAVERRFRTHSFLQSMSHRPVELTESAFDNHEHNAWVNPFTHTVQTSSFQDLFAQAAEAANTAIPQLLGEEFDAQQAQAITLGLNFSGDPVKTN